MPVPYFGAKNWLAAWINSYFPQHSTYCEPFCGSAAVTYKKRQSCHEWINDLYGPVINYHTRLRDEPVRLIQEICELALDYQVAEPRDAATVTAAAEFYLYCCRSFCGGGTRWSSGARTVPRKLNLNQLRGESRRLQNVKITRLDALEIIGQCSGSETLVYVDSPYLKSVRGSKDNRSANPTDAPPRRQYHHEFQEQANHEKLLDAIAGSNAMFVVSGYDSALYQQRLTDWVAVRRQVQKTAGDDEEVLWISPNAWSKLPQARKEERRQLALWQ